MSAGRFAPSPSGDLHLGNLRTAVIAWLAARSSGRDFLLRIEDLDRDRCKPEYAATQMADLSTIGIDWDGEPWWQSDRDDAYRDALTTLTSAGHTYECFCTRREIREAQSAPHGSADARYPGTCRDLSATQRAAYLDAGRTPAIRLAGHGSERSWDDQVRGPSAGVIDDVVLARADGAIAYNLAVVVDDIAQDIDQIVRGDDLTSATPTQILLTELLGGSPATYAHVPLVLNHAGQRLAKRDGAVTVAALLDEGRTIDDVRRWIATSLGPALPADPSDPTTWVSSFNLAQLPREPVVFTALL